MNTIHNSPLTNRVKIGACEVGGNDFCLIAGPCSLESLEHFQNVAHRVKSLGAVALRGGMFKLRTSPESFQGLGKEAYSIARQVKQEVQLPFISEVTDPRHIGDMLDLVDAFQVGSRNMYNYSLLKELGSTDKPILLKRGFSALIKEWLLAADYIVKGGNDQVILCERGIRSFETATRNTFDINAVSYIKRYSSFPIVADPSHGTGDSRLVVDVALAAVAAGCDGLLIEVHPNPSQALSDGFQALDYAALEDLTTQLNLLLPVFGKRLGDR